MNMVSFACPFCSEEIPERATVCRACRRDIAIPASLEAEHRELSLRRDALRAELGHAKARLADHRWFGRWSRNAPEDPSL
jgi:hypothetical protein